MLDYGYWYQRRFWLNTLDHNVDAAVLVLDLSLLGFGQPVDFAHQHFLAHRRWRTLLNLADSINLMPLLEAPLLFLVFRHLFEVGKCLALQCNPLFLQSLNSLLFLLFKSSMIILDHS